jgi:hypothetical protein
MGCLFFCCSKESRANVEMARDSARGSLLTSQGLLETEACQKRNEATDKKDEKGLLVTG